MTRAILAMGGNYQRDRRLSIKYTVPGTPAGRIVPYTVPGIPNSGIPSELGRNSGTPVPGTPNSGTLPVSKCTHLIWKARLKATRRFLFQYVSRDGNENRRI